MALDGPQGYFQIRSLSTRELRVKSHCEHEVSSAQDSRCSSLQSFCQASASRFVPVGFLRNCSSRPR